jgi:hypothetical protein
MTKTDEILLELNRKFAEYIESVGEFEHEGEIYKIVHYFDSSPYMKCNICGNSPKVSIFIIKSDADKLRVGNECIDRLTNRNVSKRFKGYGRKRKNVIANRNYIDGLASIMSAQRSKGLPFQIAEGDTDKLRKAFERMCNGLNPTRKQQQIAKSYISKIEQ